MGSEKNTSFRGDEVVISGVSGVFPNSDSVLEFGENLFNKVDMVSDEPRWTSNDPEVPKHVGKINGIEKFDAQFFKVGYQQARVLEPVSRKILEHAYGAIFDSGNTHATVKGKKIGVFVGSSFVDFSSLCFYDIKHPSDFVVGGSSKSMLANRISYWVDGKGPSYCLDYSCASSAAALEKAYNSIRRGDCDAAIVGAGNICSHPTLSVNLRRAGLLSLDGKTRCFDKNADGYVRAEAVTLLFLEKAKDAKRIYAEVYHAKGIYGLKRESQFLPVHKSDDIQEFLNDFYSEIDIDPKDVEYVETNGAAIPEADANELDAIGHVFANDKTVKVGCVKSNMGHSEATSGLTAVVKMCLSYHKGEVPANLNYDSPHDHISAISNGKLNILTEHSKFNRGYVAINNFSYTGANYHIVLKGHYKKKNVDKYISKVPRIVLASGREESCVNKILDSLKMKPIDAEQIALLHSIFEKDVIGHTGRGYAILDTNKHGETVSVSESVTYYSGVRRPLWFVYSGMGSQWAGMGADLMRIPTFARAIDRCHKVLTPKGIDIVKIITEPDKTIFDSTLNAFVGIGAVQIGLTDILKEMGIEPDYIIGHSLGEMVCAYHDNTFTTEETILSTYSRGKAVLESNLIKGSMAAVGLGYKALLNQCPPDIDIGCHNSSESATLSGPAESMSKFVGELTKKGVFAREVPSANIAYHSRYMADAGPALLQSLREVIKEPKLRSNKWISTSAPRECWEEETARYSSPEYHMNNMLSPVLFEETISLIPSNAVLVEIAPHGLLQAILKRSHPECTHVPLTRRGCDDGVLFLLQAIGKLYEAGYNPKVDILYPQVEFPVSTETPLLSHLIQWEHTENWPVLNIVSGDKITSSTRDVTISIHDDDHKYIADHIINGVASIPEAALLIYVWETLAMSRGADYQYISVTFKQITFYSEVIVKPDQTVKLSVVINKGNDQFEISQDDKIIVTGTASAVRNLKFQHKIESPDDAFDDIRINSEVIYKAFAMRGYNYEEGLQSILSININRKNAFIKWNDNWVSFLDSLIQLNTVFRDHNGVSKPKFIRKLRISVIEQEIYNELLGNGSIEYLTAEINTNLGVTRCAGVEIDNITYLDKPAIKQKPDVLKEKSFFPYFSPKEIDMKTALEITLQVVADNVNTKNVNIHHFGNKLESKIPDLYNRIEDIADWIPDINMKIKYVTNNNDLNMDRSEPNVLVLENLLEHYKVMEDLKDMISHEDFILTVENQIPSQQNYKKHFNVLTCMSDGVTILLLLKKHEPKSDRFYFPITMDNKFSWVSRVYGELKTTKKVVLVSEKQPYCGLSGFVKTLKNEGCKNISFVDIQDIHAQAFTPNNESYMDQLEKNLAFNVLKKGQWGSYFYTSCSKSASARSFTLKTLVPGDLDKLTWVESPPLPTKRTLVQVYYSGLSLKDCQKAVDDFKTNENAFGMDFSGIDKNGDRVMGLVSGGSTSSSVEVDPDLLWPVPDHWTLEDAATVPLPYIHAYYCLVLRGKLRKGQTVLIIGGSGAFGQALINLSLALDCTIMTTVSDMGKKKILLKLFPTLNEDNISYSDHDNLYNMVMLNTKKQGCDLVISCATGALRETAMKCVGFRGFLLDVNKHDMLENKDIGMAYLNWDRSGIAVDLANIFKPEFYADKKVLQKCLKEGISFGIVKPLSRVVYTPTLVCRAFKLLSSRRHIGRVLVRIQDPGVTSRGLDVLPRILYTPEDVVIIVCDEKGVGVELADKLISRGAKRLILNMKHGMCTGYVQTKFISWSKHQVSVKLSSENLHTELGTANLMRSAGKFGKVASIFIVQDTKESEHREKDFVDSFNGRCKVVMNLDLASRNHAELRHFVIVSHLSLTASDEYALSLSERVCELRNEMGLPALVMRHATVTELSNEDIANGKVQSQSISTLFDSLEASLKMKFSYVLTFNLKKRNSSDFHKKVASVLGVRDINNLDKEIVLQDLKLNEINLKELRCAIKSTVSVDYPIEKIRLMTIKELTEITELDNKKNTDFNSGMSAFYKQVRDEEAQVSEQPIEVMPTLLNHSNELSIDSNNTYMIMIPGFDGIAQSLRTVAERLKIQAVGVQLGPDIEESSISDIAINVRKILKRKFTIKSKFYIMGYSFGANIALELAAILENEGHVGVVYLLDSSPDALREHLNAYLDKIPEGKLQNTILLHMYHLMTENKEFTEDLERELENCNSWEEKLDKCSKTLKRIVSHSEQYTRQVLETAYKRIILAKEYNPKFKLQSKIVLMKGIPHPKSENVSDNYNLSRLSNKPVTVFNIQSDHALACQDGRVSNIINKFIDVDILQAFKKESLCNVYYTHGSNLIR